MKVYVLDEISVDGGTVSSNIMGVYRSPKVAKKHLEKYLGIKTKGMWNKQFEDSRHLTYNDSTYTITEFEIVEK